MYTNIIRKYFGKILNITRVSPIATHVICDGRDMKLEVYKKFHGEFESYWEPGKAKADISYKLTRSLPVHKEALKAGLFVPRIIKIIEKDNVVYKFTEWIYGNTISAEMKAHPDKVKIICEDLGRYVTELYAVKQITPVDPHFENFVWTKNGAIYVDLKKFLYCRDEIHTLQMAKICLKSCKGVRKKAFYFLKGYSKYSDINQILEYCNKENWTVILRNKQVYSIKPISLEEIENDK